MDSEVEDVCYIACMIGGKRNTKQRLRTNAPTALAPLKGLACDGSHDHAPWSSGPHQLHTAEEAEYPEAFCELVAKCFAGTGTRQEVASRAEQCASGAMAAAQRPRRKADMHHKSSQESILVGSVRVGDRLEASAIVESAVCPHGNGYRSTALHMFWDCTLHSKVRKDAHLAIDILVNRAKQKYVKASSSGDMDGSQFILRDDIWYTLVYTDGSALMPTSPVFSKSG